MSKILITHPNLMEKGGAEAVCMNVLEALQDDHEVVVLTAAECDFDELNDYFDTRAVPSAVRRITGVLPAIDAASMALESTTSVRLDRLKESVFKRATRRDAADADLLVSTRNEQMIHTPSVQYIHLPRSGLIYECGRSSLPEGGGDPALLYAVYDRLCRYVDGYDTGTIAAQTLLTNSQWTADLVERIYGTRPRVVYPPVDTDAFKPCPWSEREDGFVTIGQVSPQKHVHRTLDIVSALRDRGYDVHLHVVGPDKGTDYARRIRERASAHDFIHYEGAVSRERLVELVTTHRYGIHGMEREHFGIAVAELAAGGTIPFVPRTGGQTEIVNGNEWMTYGTTDEAVETIAAVLDSQSRQAELRRKLGDVDERFGRERFHREIREVVAAALAAR